MEVHQPINGYRAGTDPVFLAAAVPALAGETVLDLGCGVGAAALCLWHRTRAKLTGIELQPDYARLARLNASDNGADFEVVEADIAELTPDVRGRSFNHVITNPPYFPPLAGTSARDQGREIANREVLPLEHWIDAAIRRLAPRGTLTVILRADRLTEALAALAPRIGGVAVKPLAARHGRAAKRVVVQGVKGSRSPLRLLPPLVLHEGARHEVDGENFSGEAQAILREGRKISLD